MHLVKIINPFVQADGRTAHPIKEGQSINDLYVEHSDMGSFPMVCLYNNEPLLRANWDKKPTGDDIVTFLRLATGGASFYEDTLTEDSTGNEGYYYERGVSSLINQGSDVKYGDPIIRVSFADGSRAYRKANPSPNDIVVAGKNTARLGEPIPVIYGDVYIYPDTFTYGYIRADGPEYRWFVQFFISGLGTIGVDNFSVDGVSVTDLNQDAQRVVIASYSQSTFEPSQFGNSYPMFVRTAKDITRIQLETTQSESIHQLHYPNVGDSLLVRFFLEAPNGFYGTKTEANPAGNASVVFTIDEYEDDGTHRGTITTTLTGSSLNSAQATGIMLFSYSFALDTQATYLRVSRASSESSSPPNRLDVVNVIFWRSNDLVVGTTATISVVSIRIDKKTQDLDFNKVRCRASRYQGAIGETCEDILTNTIYGGSIPTSVIDTAGMSSLDTIYASRGDSFNGVFDKQTSLWDALGQVGLCGRARPIVQGGIVRLIRDSAQSVPVAVYNMRNIVSGSFSINYRLPADNDFDSVRINYFGGAFNTPSARTQAIYSTTSNPLDINLKGCTNYQQATRELSYHAAVIRYRRKTINFVTELEGYIPTFGDLVVVSHDVPEWGVSGDVRGYDVANGLVLLSEPVVFTGTSASSYYVAFRKKNGGMYGPYAVAYGDDGDKIEFSGNYTYTTGEDFVEVNTGSETFRLYYGTEYERTSFIFGVGTEWTQRAIVKSIKPAGKDTIRMTLINEDDNVHAT